MGPQRPGCQLLWANSWTLSKSGFGVVLSHPTVGGGLVGPRRTPNMSSGQRRPAAGAIVSSLIYFAFAVNWIWGIGWTFYRHGSSDGFVALCVPPYAWYRGVAAIWDEPKWKKD